MKKIVGFIFLVLFISLAQAQSDFLQLARTGTADEIRTAIEAGADANTADRHGQTPLIYALTNPDLEVLTVLLEAGADVNALTNSLWTPLMYAARDTKNPEVIIRLLEYGATVSTRNPQGLMALRYASQNQALKRTPVHMHLLNAYWAEGAGASPPTTLTRNWWAPEPILPPVPHAVWERSLEAQALLLRAAEAPRSCCRVCIAGQACGNTCIAQGLTCHRTGGCACNVNDPGAIEFFARSGSPEMLFLTSFACDVSAAASNIN